MNGEAHMSNFFDKGKYPNQRGVPQNYSSYQPPPPPDIPPYDQYGAPSDVPHSQPRVPYNAKPRGCAQGCLTIFIIFVLIIAGLVWYAWSWFKKNFYENEPFAFAKVELTQQQKKTLAIKLAVVKEAFDKNNGEEVELSLSQDELNWLIQNPNAGFELGLRTDKPEEPAGLKDNWRGYFEFPAEDILSFKISIAEKEKFDGGAPYLNIKGTTNMTVEDGKIKLKVTELKTGKFQFPASMLEGFNEGISEKLQNNPQLIWIWDRLRSLKIEKGTIYLKLRALKIPVAAEQPAEQNR